MNEYVHIEVKSDDKVEKRLKEMALYMKNLKYIHYMTEAGNKGVAALQAATPKRTGATADAWTYEIRIDDEGATLSFLNNNVVKDWFNVALALQYGHGTGTGGYVPGIDYINPALHPIFDELQAHLVKVGDITWGTM